VFPTVRGAANDLGFSLLSARKEVSRLGHCRNKHICGRACPGEIPVSKGGIGEESVRPQSITAMHSQ
jgi:hypothetical protein